MALGAVRYVIVPPRHPTAKSLKNTYTIVGVVVVVAVVVVVVVVVVQEINR